MTETIFDNNTQKNDQNLLETLVGEGKKFKTAEDLAKGKHEADAFIERLTTENNELRMRLAENDRLEELVNRLEAAAKGNTGGTTPLDDSFNDNTGTDGLTEDVVNRLVETKIEAIEKHRSERGNLEAFKTQLKGIFGTDFEQKVKQRMDTLGLSESDLIALGKKSPKAALAALGVSANGDTGTPQSPPKTSLSLPVGTNTTGTRNYAFYEQLRKSDPKRYWDAQTQIQLHKDALNQGENFYKT